MDMGRPGRGVPGLAVARGHHVDVAIENKGPLTLCPKQPGDQDRLGALDFHPGKARMPFQQGDIGLELVHLQAALLERKSDQVLRDALVTDYRWDAQDLVALAHEENDLAV